MPNSTSSTSPSTRRAVLELLAGGGFHSGEALGAQLGVSRAAIAKAVDGLRGQGVEVDAVTGRGYRLPDRVDLLSSEAIAGHLPGELAQRLHGLDVALVSASTNAELLDQARAGAGARALFAEIQTAGRGRWGRGWISPFGRSLAFSLLWPLPAVPGGVAPIGLAVGVGLATALNELAVDGVQLKWPNDLLTDSGKLGGVLVELVGEPAGPCSVVIGVGLNLVLTAAERAAVPQPVSDLRSVMPAGAVLPERNALAAALLSAVAGACERYGRYGFEPFVEPWRALDAYAGQEVDVHLPNGRVSGVARGIDPEGGLRLQTPAGIRVFASGDLRVRLKS